MCEGYDDTVTVLRDGRELGARLLADGEDPLPVEDGKSVGSHVDRAKVEQRSRRNRKPVPNHPRRRAIKPKAAGVVACRRRAGTADPLNDTSKKGDISELL